MILTIKLRLFVQVGNFLPFLCEKIFHKVEDKYTPVSGLCWSASTPCSTIRVQTGFIVRMKYPETRQRPSGSTIGVTVSTADALFSNTVSY